jgi:hypothetical protein
MLVYAAVSLSCAKLRGASGLRRGRDRLPLDPLGRIEGGDGIVECRDVADVRLQPPVTQPPDDLAQLGTMTPAFLRRESGRRRLLDVSAHGVEHQVDAADVVQRVVAKVDELLRAEVEWLLTVGSADGRA